ncbi:MAG: hypothetical protein AAGC63_08385, partial [Propionicimonas sp.]
ASFAWDELQVGEAAWLGQTTLERDLLAPGLSSGVDCFGVPGGWLGVVVIGWLAVVTVVAAGVAVLIVVLSRRAARR